ncbi:MAG: hypothetical protein NTX82_02460 [Candidatus Parcubacteria bacterium]|nr:hypothetical protein [Candidatus Parcubacteria bacterium]
MIDYYKDGKRVELHAIYGLGQEGQMVVVDHVSWAANSDTPPDLAKYPLAAYNKPSLFVIKERKQNSYILIDNQGKEIEVDRDDGSYLYPAQEWAEFRKEEALEKFRRKDARIAHLESQVDLLRNILIQQGVKLITSEQAEVIKELFGKKG